MRSLKLWYMMVLVVCLTACATAGLPKTTQAVINEADIYLIATSQQITANARNNFISRKEAEGQINDVRRYAVQLDKAQKLLDTGDITNAKTQSDIVHAAILSLRQRVFAKRTGAIQ